MYRPFGQDVIQQLAEMVKRKKKLKKRLTKTKKLWYIIKVADDKQQRSNERH
jgi:hypothetical protein